MHFLFYFFQENLFLNWSAIQRQPEIEREVLLYMIYQLKHFHHSASHRSLIKLLQTVVLISILIEILTTQSGKMLQPLGYFYVCLTLYYNSFLIHFFKRWLGRWHVLAHTNFAKYSNIIWGASKNSSKFTTRRTIRYEKRVIAWTSIYRSDS